MNPLFKPSDVGVWHRSAPNSASQQSVSVADKVQQSPRTLLSHVQLTAFSTTQKQRHDLITQRQSGLTQAWLQPKYIQDTN